MKNINKVKIPIVILALGIFAMYGVNWFNTYGDAVSVNKKPLYGKVICIDPGHQQLTNLKKEAIAPGSKIKKIIGSTGTCGRYSGVPEYKLNLEIAKILKKKLEAQGASIVMTRTKNKVIIGNIARAKFANKSGADLTIRIHGDGSLDRSIHGISVLIPGKKYIDDIKMITSSKNAGYSILKHTVKETGAKSRGISVRNDMTGFNWSEVPSILIEVGFMSNKNEDIKLTKMYYKEKIANGIAKGTIAYFEKNE